MLQLSKRVGLLVVCALAPGHLLADDNLSPYALYNVTHDSNLFRLNRSESELLLGNQSQDDTITQIGAGLEAKIPLSRQVVKASAQIVDTRFSEYEDLDYLGANSRVQWEWLLARRWAGDVVWGYERVAHNFEDRTSSEQDIRSNRYGQLHARYLIDNNWTINTHLRQSESFHSLSTQKLYNNQIYGVKTSLMYLNPAKTTASLSVGIDEIKYPYRNTVSVPLGLDTSYQDLRYGVSVGADWRRDVARLNAELGGITRYHETLDSRDFSGFTFRSELVLALTGALTVDFSGWQSVEPVEEVQANHVKEKGWKLHPVWRLSDKIQVDLTGYIKHREYQNDEEHRADDVSSVSLGIHYAPRQKWLLALNYRVEDRRSSEHSYEYQYEALTGSAQYIF